jgi:hypothetical protein
MLLCCQAFLRALLALQIPSSRLEMTAASDGLRAFSRPNAVNLRLRGYVVDTRALFSRERCVLHRGLIPVERLSQYRILGTCGLLEGLRWK